MTVKSDCVAPDDQESRFMGVQYSMNSLKFGSSSIIPAVMPPT